MNAKIEQLEKMVQALSKTVGTQNNTITALNDKVSKLENETIVNKRIKLLQQPVEVPLSTTWTDTNIDIELSTEEGKNVSIKDYKYIEVQVNVHWTSVVGNHNSSTVLIATDSIEYYDGDEVNWGNDSTFDINTGLSEDSWAGIVCWVKDRINNEDKDVLHIGGSRTSRTDWDKLKIINIWNKIKVENFGNIFFIHR